MQLMVDEYLLNMCGPVTFEKLIKPKIYEGNRFSKKMIKGTFTMRLYEGLDENGEKNF